MTSVKMTSGTPAPMIRLNNFASKPHWRTALREGVEVFPGKEGDTKVRITPRNNKQEFIFLKKILYLKYLDSKH